MALAQPLVACAFVIPFTHWWSVGICLDPASTEHNSMGLTFHPHDLLLFQCEHLTSRQSVQHCFFAYPRLCPPSHRPELLLPQELGLCPSQPGHHHNLGRRPSSSRRFVWQLHSHLKGRPGPPPPTSQSSRGAQSHQDKSRAQQREAS